MESCLAVEGSTNAVVFETYIEKILAPTLEPGQIVVMDDLCAHKDQRVKELIEGRGCELLYLPLYSSPDFNPIEEAFAKTKGLLRKAEARTREALVEAIGSAISPIMLGAFSTTVGTTRGFNRFDERFKYKMLAAPADEFKTRRVLEVD